MLHVTQDPRTHEAVVVIPTYCEKDNVIPIIKAVLASAPCDVLVVDDDSPDLTAEEARKLSDTDPRVHVLIRKNCKPGLGPSYLEGFGFALRSGYRYVIQMDADFSHPPAFLPAMLAAVQHADLVIGSRYVDGGEVDDWAWTRRLLSRAGSLYAQRMLDLNIRDVTGGFKCWRSDALASICRATPPLSWGFAFQIEMNTRAQRGGMRIKEIPIRFAARERGSSKMSVKIFLEGLSCVWRMRCSR